MAIGVTCPECSYSFSVRDEYAGKRGKCPQCGGVFRADAAAEEAPMIVANGSHGGAKRRNGTSDGPAFASVAVSAPVHTSGYSGTSSSSGYAKRQRSGGMPKWGWAAIGLMLLAAGGSIAGAFMLSPDPAEVKKIVKERTSKAAKAITKVENEVLEKLDETEEKIDLEDKIEEFARPKTIDTDVIPGVVKVLNVQGGGPRGSGTGWIFNDQHWIATNHHVVAGCESLYVMTADGKKHDIEGVIADKKEWDLAILKPTKLIEGAKPLKIAPNDGSYLPNAGDKVWAIGNPASHLFTATHGIITRRVSQRQLISEASQTDTAFYADPERDIMWIEHDARIFPGNSGGPLLDENFRVIGVNTLLEMLPLERSIEAAKKNPRQGLRLTPTFGLASNSMYILELIAEHSDGKVKPFSSIDGGD
jgi:S1-C subfamily serine protease